MSACRAAECFQYIFSYKYFTGISLQFCSVIFSNKNLQHHLCCVIIMNAILAKSQHGSCFTNNENSRAHCHCDISSLCSIGLVLSKVGMDLM